MARVKLDKIDLTILEDLQNDGRITNVELAKNAGISAPPCLRRVRALEKSGYIEGYHARINAGKMGYGISAFAEISLNRHSEEHLKAFEALIETWPMVREAYMLTGDVDVMLKIVAEDWESYQNFLTGTLTAAPNVDHVRSMLTVRTSTYKAGIPIDKTAIEKRRKNRGD